MKRTLLLSLFLISIIIVRSQTQQERQIIHGTVLLKDVPTVGVHVVNNTTSEATTTNKYGEFSIRVSLNDLVIFSTVNTQVEERVITKDVLAKNRLVIDLKEQVVALDEVDLGGFTPNFGSPEYIKNMQVSPDQYSKVQNETLNPSIQGGQFGVDFISLIVALFKSKKRKKKERLPSFREKTKFSEALLGVFDETFYTKDLQIPKERITDFLYFCDEQEYPVTIFKKENEFQLIDFLVILSEKYNKVIKN